MEFIRDFFKITKDVPKDFNRNDILTYASSAAFFLFLSIFPIVMLVLAIVSSTGIKQYELYQVVVVLFPESFNEIIKGIVKELYTHSFAFASMSAILAIWSSSSGVYAIAKGLNRIYKKNDRAHEVPFIKFVFYRIGICIHTIFLIVAIIAVIYIIIFSKKMTRFLCISYPTIAPLILYLGRVRFIFAFVIMIVMFVLLYAALPKKNRHDIKSDRLIYHLPGACIASVIWIGFSVLFSSYVSYVTENSYYGSLLTIVLFMIWMFALMVVLLIGAQINASITAHKIMKKELKIIRKRQHYEQQIRRARMAIKKSGGNMFDI